MSLAKYAYFNGEIVPWDEAKVHVYSPAFKYGLGVFEGIRGYWNEDEEQLYLFKLREHMDRLVFSQRVIRYDRIIDANYLAGKTVELVRENAFRETIHIRAVVYADGYAEMSTRGPTEVAITAVPRPLPKRVTEGCTVQVASWRRNSDQAMPARVKCNANYVNGRFAAVQAVDDGYDTAILINSRGKVSEGPSMCFFMVRDGRLVTPSITNDILESITRSTVLEIGREYLDLETEERDVDRSELYAAEEAFFCGTGWEITPITGFDRLPVGTGGVGSVVKRLQEVYFNLVHGRRRDHAEWLTPVYEEARRQASG